MMPLPHGQQRNACIKALLAIKVRIAFIGCPDEPMWTPLNKPVPDWRKEIALLEEAIAAMGAQDCPLPRGKK